MEERSHDLEAMSAELDALTGPEEVAAILEEYEPPADRMQQAEAREAVMARLKGVVRSPAKFADAWLATAESVNGSAPLQGETFEPETPEPWDGEVTAAEVLDEVVEIFRAYTHAEETSLVALALWVVYTHVFEQFDVSPILDLTSPTKRCGKSSTLIIVRRLSRHALLAGNISPASLFRSVSAWKPTLLADEADTWAKTSDELRGIYNAGHTRDTAHVVRAEGDANEPRLFSTFCPKAVAAIGHLPDTIEDRSVRIPLMRKPKTVKKADAFSVKGTTAACKTALRKIVTFAETFEPAEVERPDELHDRAWNNWLPLLSIAATAGEEWLAKATEAAVTLSGDEMVAATTSELALMHVYPVRMDLHVVFEPDEQGWVRATIEELPGVITCAPTLDEARELVRDALDEWFGALTSEERAAIGPEATRETLTLSVA